MQLNLGSLKNFTASQIKFNGFAFDINAGMSANTKIKIDNATLSGKNSLLAKTIPIPTTTLNGLGVMQKISIAESDLNSFINAFATKPPDSISLTYTTTVNPDGSAIIINDADSVYGNSNMKIPLDVGIIGGTINDETTISSMQENKDKLEDILSGTIKLRIDNGIPADVVFVGTLFNAAGDSLVLPPGQIAVKAALVNATTGLVTSSTLTTVDIPLNKTQIDFFVNSTSMKMKLVFGTSGGNASPVKFRTTDFIRVFAAGQLNYRVKQ